MRPMQRAIVFNSATITAVQPAPWRVAVDRRQSERRWRSSSQLLQGVLASAALAIVGVAIHGYHPFAEDGGPYFASILRALHPSLYPSSSAFVSAFAQYSIFSQLIAGLIRITGAAPGTAIFILHVLSVFATLLGGWLVAARCYSSVQARFGAISLLALWLTLPVAGTSLLLVDPYFTARSISTPCSLFALAAMLDIVRAGHMEWKPLWRSGCALLSSIAVAASVHPLMASYTVGCLVLLFVASRPRQFTRIWWFTALSLLAIAGAAELCRLARAATPDTWLAARTRTYWFLQNWHWYEIVGLLAPLVVLHLLTRSPQIRSQQGSRWLARMAFVAGATAFVISLFFVRESPSAYQLARLQPLRIFHVIYLVMILLLGAKVAERLQLRKLWQPVLAFLFIGGIMFCVQLRTFPASAHIEFPWAAPANGWEQAFVWIGQNTPQDALFALDSEYIMTPGEDAQYFSAISERSALPDSAKDGGLASISPKLANAWVAGTAAQTGLNGASDAERIAALRRWHADWIVLPAASHTAFPCPYSNATAKVCRLDELRLAAVDPD